MKEEAWNFPIIPNPDSEQEVSCWPLKGFYHLKAFSTKYMKDGWRERNEK